LRLTKGLPGKPARVSRLLLARLTGNWGGRLKGGSEQTEYETERKYARQNQSESLHDTIHRRRIPVLTLTSLTRRSLSQGGSSF
jgi:hypothetical protein